MSPTKSIKILENSLLEIDQPRFNSKVWKAKLITDMQLIFPNANQLWGKISQLKFGNDNESNKILDSEKNDARNLILAYIKLFKEYPEIAEALYVTDKEELVKQNYELLETIISLKKELNGLVNTSLDTSSKAPKLSEKIKNPKISFSSLGKAFINLKITSLIVVISFLGSIFYGVFSVGKYFGNQNNEKLIKEQKQNNIQLVNNLINILPQTPIKSIEKPIKDSTLQNIQNVKPTYRSSQILNGIVIDKNDFSLISGAKIVVGNKSTFTSPLGYFSVEITNLPVNIQIAKDGYENEDIVLNSVTIVHRLPLTRLKE